MLELQKCYSTGHLKLLVAENLRISEISESRKGYLHRSLTEETYYGIAQAA